MSKEEKLKKLVEYYESSLLALFNEMDTQHDEHEILRIIETGKKLKKDLSID